MANLYGLTLVASGSSSTAYYYAQFTSGNIAHGGSVTIYPTASASTFVSITTSLAINAPAGSLTGSIVLEDDNGVIAGEIGVSPPVSVPVTATLYGTGQPIGSVTINPGQTQAAFRWNVQGQAGLEDEKEFTKQAEEPK
jgi:hypothetical protein